MAHVIRVFFPVLMVVTHAQITQNVNFSTSQHFLISSLQVCIFSFLLLVALFCKYLFNSLQHEGSYFLANDFQNLATIEIDSQENIESSSQIQINIFHMHVIGICLWFTVLVFEFTLLSLHCFVLGFCVAHFGILLKLTHKSVCSKAIYNSMFFLCLSVIIMLFVDKRHSIIIIYTQFSYRLLLHVLCFISGVFWCLQKSTEKMYVMCKQSLLTCFLQSFSHVLILHDRLYFDFIESKLIFYYIFVIAPFIKVLLISLLLVSIRRRKTIEILISFCTALVVQNVLKSTDTFTYALLGIVAMLNVMNFFCLSLQYLESKHASQSLSVDGS